VTPSRQKPTRRARRRRIGILGGTFDPVHLAHLRIAEEAREALALEEVLFVPAASPPHKSRRRISPAADRVAMLRRALTGNPAFRLSLIEIERPGRSYTIDTLRLLHERSPVQLDVTLLVGLDQFREIGTWRDYRDLFALANVAVLSRPPHAATRLLASLPVAARRDFCYARLRTTLVHESGHRVLLLDVTALDISASGIRRRVGRGQSIRYLVPRAVESYILRRGLYQRGSKRS
jgi:nicotinate-nucleotide adenylyltransferase